MRIAFHAESAVILSSRPKKVDELPRRSKKQGPNRALWLNYGIALVVLVVFLYGALAGAFTVPYAALFGLLFALWLLYNLYLDNSKNFWDSFFKAIIGIILVLVLYLLVTLLMSGVVYELYSAGYIGTDTFNNLLYVASLLPLSASVLIYLMIYDGVWRFLSPAMYSISYVAKNPASIAQQLGFGKGSLSLKYIAIGLMIFAVILCVELVVGLLSSLTNIQVNTNVSQLFSGAPLWFLIFAAVIEPINEEIFFRGFLVKRLGVLPSAMIFGLAHYTYNSTFGVEVMAAFIFGLISGYIFKRTGSIWPGIIAHILVNSLAALSIVGMGT